MIIKQKVLLFKLEHENNIEIVEYCSLLSNDEKFKYDPNKEKVFSTIGCNCLKDGIYDLTNVSKSKDKCSHSTMISDMNLIQHLRSIVSKELIYDGIDQYPISIKKALMTYEKKDFLSLCNELLTQ